ncbi:LacI family DNA-binding transcriptional regulator [Kushneria indalinina]|uniref:DNA-binding LacI/PurR family transcriptional regulator n=1 Tax=Kushneria indalinina DSM 14324 TaxID=1122140 RepID=A0A3D9DYD3_9GAMM|nr:LacI family DNA-binding transcriptional regulator [Kushneria indalinina]REC95274.1 DNA-binding LacI/PurR family transcriptional regulator [Kushneria indalinina DSM 14324]
MSRRRRPATLKSIAAHLGVSTATVSNAFNRPDQLSSTRREEILAAARALGYEGPSSRGRTLRTGRTDIIGVMLSDGLGYSLGDSVASGFLAGIAEVLDASGHHLLLLTDAARTDRQPPSLNGLADGYLIYGSIPEEATVALLRHQHQPLVTVDMRLPGLASVQIDHRAAALAIARHALAGGAQRPAVVALCMTLDSPGGRLERRTHWSQPNAVAIERLAGFDQALEETGHDPDRVPLWNVDGNTFEAAAPVIEALLAESSPDLLLCMSDRLALTALSLAEQRGLPVPGALRLTGFDGIDEGQRRRPTLTTVYQDSHAKGVTAARMVTGECQEHDVLHPVWLIHGDTCPTAS